MFWRFRWFSVCLSALFVGFAYELARRMQESHYATMHPILVAASLTSGIIVVGGMFASCAAGHENIGFLGIFGFAFGGMAPIFLNDHGPGPWHEVNYVFPSWGDYLLTGIIVSNAILALLMVFMRVPKGKMLIVNGRVYYGGDQPTFLPWMKYNVERFDEIPVKVEFHCAAGTSVMCEAVLAPNAEWCRINGVRSVNAAHFKENAAQILKNIIGSRAEIRNANWLSAGEMLDTLASLDVAALQGIAAGVSFHCLRFSATASTTRPSSNEADAAT